MRRYVVMDDITKKRIEDIFYYNKSYVEPGSVCEFLTEATVFCAEDMIREKGIRNDDKVVFKLISQLIYLEKDFEENKKEIAHLSYVIGNYVGLFSHPTNGDDIGVYYLNKALDLAETDEFKATILDAIDMIVNPFDD